MAKSALKHLLLSLFVSFFTACSSSKHHTTEKITLGLAAWPGYDIIYYAKIKHLFHKHNLNVELIKFPDQLSTVDALKKGKVDAAMLSLWDVLQIKNAPEQFDIIVATDISAGSDGIVAQKKIHSVKDLYGKRVSLQKGSVSEQILLEALALNHMNRDDVITLNMTNETALSSLYHKKIDAAVEWEPLLSKANEKIHGNIIFTTKELDSCIVDIVVVPHSKFIKNIQQWKDFLFVWFDITEALHKKEQEVLQSVGNILINPNFANDYKGLRPGTIGLNKKLFIENEIEKKINKIYTLMPQKAEKNFEIPSYFIQKSIQDYLSSTNSTEGSPK